MAATYSELPNKLVSAANEVDYAYREAGAGVVPLVLLQHFRGNLDSWDPALIDALASSRHVVTFDNAGVGGSTGTTPNTVVQMAHDAVAFLAAMEFDRADILGFSRRTARLSCPQDGARIRRCTVPVASQGPREGLSGGTYSGGRVVAS
jgi:hypothetical protein